RIAAVVCATRVRAFGIVRAMRGLRLVPPFALPLALVACSAPPASAPPASAPPPASASPASPAPLPSTPSASTSPAPAAAAPHHWTYEGDEGPARWGSLAPEFATCGKGAKQSPIEISTTAPADPALALSTPRP